MIGIRIFQVVVRPIVDEFIAARNALILPIKSLNNGCLYVYRFPRQHFHFPIHFHAISNYRGARTCCIAVNAFPLLVAPCNSGHSALRKAKLLMRFD